MPERTALYRLYDADNRLLYVGIASDPERRWRDHATDRARFWWPLVTKKEVQWFDSRPQAAEAEIEAIRAEDPRHNSQYGLSPMLALLPPSRPDETPRGGAKHPHDPRAADVRIAAEIRRLITDGGLPVGSRLPTTDELVERFNSSNVTIQRALKILKEERFVHGVAGVAVYVSSPVPFGFEDSTRLERSAHQARRVPPPRIAAMLHLPEAEEALYEQFLVTADETPVELVSTYRRLPQHDAPPPLPHTQRDEVTARVPATDEFVALRMPSKTPVLCIYRTTLTESGEPTEVQCIVRPGHIHRLSYTA